MTDPKGTDILQQYNRQHRVHAIDWLRGFAMVYIMLYHLFYDLTAFGGIHLPFFYTGWWEVIHICFVSLLFAVSGISTRFSRNSLRRGVVIFFLGQAITVGTAIAEMITGMYGIIIVFGVLTFIGLSMMIYWFIRPYLKLDWRLLLTIALLFFAVFLIFPIDNMVKNGNFWLFPFGITAPDFYSSDYFPLIPYFFIFLAGAALAEPITAGKLPKPFYERKIRPIEFIGRHSLAFYLIHQPALIIILFLTGVINFG
jgi:uncharacterized membrane protein